MQVPAGVDSGTRIQLVGAGEVGPGGGPRGDLYVEIRVAADPTYERHGDDLHCTLEVPMTAAALGASVPLETFDGEREVEVARGSQGGDTITLGGLGVTNLDTGRRGDIVVHTVVTTPTRLDARQEELLRELASLRGEERPTGQVTRGSEGIFGKLRDAFKAK